MPPKVISGISSCFQLLFQCQGQVAHVLLTRSPLVYPRKGLSVRLACVKHAASVRPEPGSNSPKKNPNPSKHQPQKRASAYQRNQHQKRCRQNNWHWHKQKHPVEFSKNKHTPSCRLFRGVSDWGNSATLPEPG